ncbi:MAG: penicillin-binding protein, partial [Nocardiopsis sp. BM-2018]
MPDVICLGGGELSKSTHGSGGTDGQRPDSNTPETNDTSAEELSSHATPQGDNLPTAGEDQSTGEASAEEKEDDGLPEPEFIAGPIAFKTSGTFFRDRVAQTLAEQGFETGDMSSLESETPPSDTPEAADAAAEDDSDGGAEPEEPRTERIQAEEAQGSADPDSEPEPDSEPATEKIPARGQDESVGDPVAAAAAVAETGPATQPFQLPDEDDDQEHNTPTDSDEPRTEAMPAPAPGTVPFAAAPPEA